MYLRSIRVRANEWIEAVIAVITLYIINGRCRWFCCKAAGFCAHARTKGVQVLQLVVFTDLQNKIRRNKPPRCLVCEWKNKWLGRQISAVYVGFFFPFSFLFVFQFGKIDPRMGFREGSLPFPSPALVVSDRRAQNVHQADDSIQLDRSM